MYNCELINRGDPLRFALLVYKNLFVPIFWLGYLEASYLSENDPSAGFLDAKLPPKQPFL